MSPAQPRQPDPLLVALAAATNELAERRLLASILRDPKFCEAEGMAEVTDELFHCGLPLAIWQAIAAERSAGGGVELRPFDQVEELIREFIESFRLKGLGYDDARRRMEATFTARVKRLQHAGVGVDEIFQIAVGDLDRMWSSEASAVGRCRASGR